MTLRILNSPSEPDRVAEQMRDAIQQALPGAVALVASSSPGHFEVQVRWGEFAGKPRVRQQQLVYGAIAPFMKGDAPPVHAIDRLETVVP